jgi:hypothetical protein
VRSKENWDSGYHGITDDEMEVERIQSQVSNLTKEVVEEVAEESAPVILAPEERRSTTETFVSAREDASRKGSKEYTHDDDGSTVPDEEIAEAAPVEQQDAPVVDVIPATQQTTEEDVDEMEVDEARSPSDASSPVKPLLRKSSFTFSSLPSREPLAQKKSIGARSSVLNQTRSSFLGRFTGGKSIGGQQSSARADEEEDAMDVDAPPRPMLGREESETTKNHNHSTTEELRNRINMLGQARDMRTSKSIPNLNASTNKPIYPQIGQAQLDKSEGENARPTTAPAPAKQTMPGALEEDDEDDWIAPIASAALAETSRPAMSRTQTTESIERTVLVANETLTAHTSPQRQASPSRPKLPFGHKKAVSSSAITSPTKGAMASTVHQKAISVSNPSMPTGHESTTPVGSPKRGHLDGAVSATKAKLYSAFRSAKGIFASSAGVSAQAKMETLSPGPKARQANMDDGYFASAEVQYPDLPGSRVASAETAVSSGTQDGRRTRSSSEREHKRKEQEAKQMQKMDDELEKIREKERQKAAAAAAYKLQKSPSKETIASQRSTAPSRADSERSKATEADSADEMPPPPPPKSMLPTGQAQRLREPRRIAKPTKEVAPKAKPAPVTIRMHVPSQLGHRPTPGPSTAALSQSLQDSLPPPPPPKPTMASKASTTSLHSSTSTSNLRTGNPSAAAKKALDAAAKKKEADAKAAQRKAERQREIEQRRQAKLEDERRKQEEERRKQEEEKRRVDEERRAEQRRRQAEIQRKEEAKRQAERQAAEQRRIEQERLDQQRLEQQRLQQQRLEQQRAQQDGFAYAMKHDKTQTANAPRGDMGGARPISRMMHHDGRPAVQVNPAKPKRALAEEDDQYQRPGVQRNPPSYQQNDAKRRRTNEEEDEPMDQRRSVMAGPPVRQSNIRKDNNKFPHGYNAVPASGQHAPSMFIKTVTGQHQVLHSSKQTEMSQFANGRIPFANAPNPPASASAANPHKTPGRQIPNHHLLSTTGKSGAKSSPHYPNPESIDLPDIATDSEDEDSENEFQAPSWTESPALRQLLEQQQMVDAHAVFGPIAPLRMEEVFRNKERQKKFRDRTSSAQWHADRLTEEERVKDREARERLMKDGGWTFVPGQ